MKIETFAMERMQSLFEHEVKYNLTESGVWPMRIRDVLGGDEAVAAFVEQQAFYAEAPGSDLLRGHIANWYPGAGVENVSAMAGGAEANYTTLWTLLEPGDRAAIMLPNYMQAWGLARAYARADRFRLKRTSLDGVRRWGLDLKELDRAVTRDTKVILVTNPNNPTGAVLTEREMDAVVRVADRVDAWLLADEIYRGAEVEGDEATATFWGRYDKVIVTSGVSKAFGLPGLRLGWVVAPERLIRDLWRHHDYLSLMPSILSERLATIALEPSRREEILRRTRGIIRANLPRLERWIARHADVFDYIRPRAGAIVYLPMRVRANTQRLVDRMREEESVLIVPGEQLGLRGGLRLGYGYDIEHTLRGLKKVDKFLARVGLAV